MTRLAGLVSRRARLVLLAMLVVVAAAGWAAATIGGRLTNGGRGFFRQSSGSIRAERPVSLASGSFNQAAVVALAPIAEAARVRAVMRADPLVARAAGPVVARDARTAYVAAFLRFPIDEDPSFAADALTRALRERVPGALVANDARGYDQIDAALSDDLPRIETIAVPLLLLLSFVVFRSVIAAALPILIAAVAVAITVVGLRLLVEVMPVSSFAINLSTGLGLGLGIDYALLMVSRYREELARAGPGPRALAETFRTAGRTVLFSAATVASALLCLLVLPLPGLRSMAASGALVAVSAAVAALLPMAAVLSLLGERVNRWAPARLQRATDRVARPSSSGGWYRLAHAVMRRPRAVALACVAVLLAAGAPALHGHLGTMDYRFLPDANVTSHVNAAIERDFPADAADPILALLPPGTPTAAYVARLRALPGAASGSVRDTPAGPLVTVLSRGLPHGPLSQRLVHAIRALHPPFAVQLTGNAAINYDEGHTLRARLPLAVALLSVCTLLVLYLMTRSVLLPVKAVLMNAVTVAATFGLLVAIFQDGGLAHALDFQTTGFLDQNNLVLLMFLVLGLSTDYGVFLLARIKEAHDAGAPNDEAVARGLERSGRIVTAAALLFCVAVGASAFARVLVVKEFAVGAALAVLIDATLIRVLLVPALMALLGEANWWLPRILRGFSARAPTASGTTLEEGAGPS